MTFILCILCLLIGYIIRDYQLHNIQQELKDAQRQIRELDYILRNKYYRGKEN